MGWLRSHGIIKIGTKSIYDYYIKDNWRSMLLKIQDSGYSDWFISDNCVIQFKVTSQETGDMEMQLNGDISGYPYYSGNGWNLWCDAGYGSSWILSHRSEGPDLGEPPVTSYYYNSTDSTYEYTGDEYYTGSFNYTCLDGTAGTFTKNTDGSTITLTAVWPSNFKKHTSGSGSSPVGDYEGDFTVGFPQWKATHNSIDYYIHKLTRRKYGHLHGFNSQSAEWNINGSLQGFYNDELGVPNLDPVKGFYFHSGSSSYPEVNNDYVFSWCHFVPYDDNPNYDGYIEFDNTNHPDITFEYQERVFETDVEEDNKGLIYMTDTSCWR